MPTPILILHGGNTFPSKEAYIEDLRTKEVHLDRMRYVANWKDNLQQALGEDFDVLLPRMPMADNAEYELWKLWFERVYRAVDEPCVLIGHSLGAMFLLKYLSENALQYETPALLLVAPLFTHKNFPETEQSSFSLEQTDIMDKKVGRVVFFHSTDDPVVPFESFTRFKEYYETSEFKAFEGRGHFLDGAFTELEHYCRNLSISFA